MKTVTVIDRLCETYVPCSGQERNDWLNARATDERAMNCMYTALVHATDFLPWTCLDSYRENLIAVWIQHSIDRPLPEFLRLISYEQGKSCAYLNEEQRAYIEIKMQHAICELADACNYRLDPDDEVPMLRQGDPSLPFLQEQQLARSVKEVIHDVE